MYESKKSSGRKDIYKYQKSSYQRHFHNSTHFNHHKYTKYKQKYDYAYSPNDLDEELIFAKVFEDQNFQKRKSLKEIDEINNTPNQFESKLDNKENISMNSNINDEIGTRMKTNDEILSLVGGSYEKYMKFQSAYTTHYAGVKYALEHNARRYNFYGITGNFNEKENPFYGLYSFKRDFGGQVVELVGEFDLITNKFMYTVFTKLVPIYRNMVKNRAKKTITYMNKIA